MQDHDLRNMVNWVGADFDQRDFNMVKSIINRTGSWAPLDEVVRLFRRDELSSAALTFFVPWIWSMQSEDCDVPNEVWHGMFQRCAYTVDKRVAKLPRRTVRVYRGATAENRDGLSWSFDVGQAAFFAKKKQVRGAPGEVWAANVPADYFYARYTEGWEQELTADVRELQVVPLANEADLPRVFRWPWERPKSFF